MGGRQMSPRGNPEKPSQNRRKKTDDPKCGKQTDAFTWNNQQAWVRAHHTKYHWQI